MKIQTYLVSLAAIIAVSVSTVLSQTPAVSASASAKSGWSNNPFEHFVFVQNKGQFDELITGKKNNIQYYASSKGVDVYFTSTGLTYRHDEYIVSGKQSEEEREREEMERDGKGEHPKAPKVKHHFLQVEWEGANASAFIEPGELQTFYYTYPYAKDSGRTTFKAACYKKITYKNIYPNIDVEYILPEKGGIKYSLVLHPGADLSTVKMRYCGAKRLKTDNENNIVISSSFGDFTDQAPVSNYQDGKAIASSFLLSGNVVSFSLSEGANSLTKNLTDQIIIIDPWTQNPGFPVNRAYDVNYDLAGNVYIAGSGSNTQPYKLAKYNNVGTLLWILTNNIGTLLGGNSYGDFAVDEVSGSVYLMAGAWAAIIKVDAAGLQTGSYPMLSFPTGFELWRAEYSRCLNKIIVGAGDVSRPYQAGVLDTSMASFTPVNVFSATIPCRDIAIMTIDPNSAFCYMGTARSSGALYPNTILDNVLIKLPAPNLTAPVWGPVADGHAFVEASSVDYTPIISAVGGGYSNGFNGMACGPRFLYTYDGSVLKKWDKNTGAFIAQVTTGGTMFATGGLSADKCDNVYAGVGTTIIEYNSSLVQIASYSVGGTCYDVKLGPNNKLYACGDGFVASIDVPALPPPTASVTPTTGCNTCNGSATAIPCGDPSGYNYLWSNNQTTQTASALCPGTYTVTITYACTDTNVVVVSVPGGAAGVKLNSTQTNACSNTGGSVTLTASGGSTPYSYSWSNGVSSVTTASVNQINNLNPGTYTVIVTDANGCSTFKIVSIINTLSINYSTKYTNCSGGNAGSIELSVSGGSPVYTYAWNNAQTGSTATGLSAGTYTVTVTDANGCSRVQTISMPSFVPVSIQTDVANICSDGGWPQKGGALVTSTTGGTHPYQYSWSDGQSGLFAVELVAGTYTVTVTDANGCTKTQAVTVGPGTAPSASFTYSPTGTICAGTTVNFTNTGTTGALVKSSWTVYGPIEPGSAYTSNFLNFSYTFSNPGTYTVNHSVQYARGGCTDLKIATITVVTCASPTITATGASICSGACATVTSSAAGGTGAYTYSWNTGATTKDINPCPVTTTTYTVTVTDGGGATATSTAVVTVNSCGCTLNAQYTKGTANCSKCGCKEWVMVTGINGTPPYNYQWPDGYDKRYKNSLCPGVYNVIVTDNNGCKTTVKVNAP